MSEYSDTISRQEARGDFAWWSNEAEQAWKAHNPERPQPPCLLGKWDFPFPLLPAVRPNCYCTPESDQYGSWEKSLEGGRSYMVGTDVPMADYIKGHRSALNAWQKVAYEWAKANPLWRLMVTIGRNEWEVYVRGEYVTLALPHQDAGGEKHYITRDGKSKILVNVD